MTATDTLLITLSGKDRPGVTAAVFAALAPLGVEVLDIEQIVARGHLTLAVLLDAGRASAAEIQQTMEPVASATQMNVQVSHGAPERLNDSVDRLTITVLSAPLSAGAIADVAGIVAEHGVNIDRIRRIAAYPVTAIVFEGTGARVDELRAALAARAGDLGVDIAVQRGTSVRRGQLLVVMDVDSTLIQDEVIDLLARAAGAEEHVAAITEAAMRGDIDFAESLRQRVEALAGLPASVIDDVRTQVRLTPGARTLVRTLKNFGFRVCLVSGGFDSVIRPLADELGIDELRANHLEIIDGRLTGRVDGDIVDREGKRRALEDFATAFSIPLSRTVAIGDGANDLDMLAVAGLGVAFNAKPAVRSAADAAVNVPYLDSVLFLLGITRDEVEALSE